MVRNSERFWLPLVVKNTIEILDAGGRWKARDVIYWSGTWENLATLIPRFELGDFVAGGSTAASPKLNAVIRLPRTAAELAIPVATVSKTYALAQHADVVEKCLEGLRKRGLDTTKLKCELGLSELGEWMNLRAYFPMGYNHTPSDGNPLALRLECFNAVDGSSRLVILFGWLRFVCSNGLVIGETKAEFRDTHTQSLCLEGIPQMISEAFGLVRRDLKRLGEWEAEPVVAERLRKWTDTELSRAWGKKAACRVFHICRNGSDVAIVDPFADGPASEKPVKPGRAVPGAAKPAKTLYDVSQALSWVATNRTNTEERVKWQTDVSSLIESLRKN